MMNELVYFQHGGENISAKTDASSQAEKNETTSSRRASTNVPFAKENTMVDAKLAPAPKDNEPQRTDGQAPRRSTRLLDKAKQRG